MNYTNLETIFSSVHTNEDFEVLKQNLDLIEFAAKEVIHRHHLPEAPLTLFADGTNIVFSYGESKVIKIFPAFHQDQFKSDLMVLKHLQGKLSVKTPKLEYEGELAGWPYIIMTKLEGTLLETLWENMEHDNKVIIMRQLGALIREVHTLPTDGLEEIDCHWEQFIQNQMENCVNQHHSKKLAPQLITQIPAFIEPIKSTLMQIQKPVLLTGEYTPMNFLVKQVDGVWHIEGLIDFGDAMLGLADYDLLGPGAFLINGDKLLLNSFITAYGYKPEELTEALSHKMAALMLLHKYSNLNVQIRIPDWQNNITNLQDLQNLVWGF